jgi:hypothetical protein
MEHMSMSYETKNGCNDVDKWCGVHGMGQAGPIKNLKLRRIVHF